MIFFVIILLFNKAFGALQLGPLFHHQELASVVSFKDNLRVDLFSKGFSVMLQLEDAQLKVPFIEKMGILLVSRQGKMTTPNTDNVITVRHGDILVIYQGPKFQKTRYTGVTVETLKSLVEKDASALVFGVVIQNPPAPEMENDLPTPTYGFVDSHVFNGDPLNINLTPISYIQSSKKDGIRSTVIILPKGLDVLVGRGGVGALVRNGLVVQNFGPQKKTIPFQPGDVVITLLSKKKGLSLRLNQAIALIRNNKRHQLATAFPSTIVFVATIVDDRPNYLEDVVMSKGTEHSVGHHIPSFLKSSWWFDGNTIHLRFSPACVLHIANRQIEDADPLVEKIDQVAIDDTIHFSNYQFKFSHLQPRDIITIILGTEGVETISVSAIRNALSGCKTPEDVQSALETLQFHPTTIITTAFVSGDIPPSKLKMVGFATNEPAVPAFASSIASWIRSEGEIKVSLSGEAAVNANASIVFTDRTKVTINQVGGAVALIINEDGLKYGSKIAFGNTYRKLKLKPEYTAPEAILELEHGDIIMVVLPPANGEYNLNPYELAANARYHYDDFDTIGEFISGFLLEGTVAAIVARVERTE